MIDKLEVLRNRLAKLGIEIEMYRNYPWVYLDKICGKKVVEKYLSHIGFTIAFMPIRNGEELKLTDISTIFSLIRTYAK